MIRNYIKTAYRSLIKNKGFTILNVLGLALGLATCLLIVFYVFDELNFDSYNKKADRIYRINEEIKFGGNENSYAVSPAPVAAALKNDFPEIEQVARFRNQGGNSVKKGNQNIREDMMIYADRSILDIFTLPMIYGNPATALTEPHTIIITERIAKKYFDRTNVVGQVLVFNNTDPYKITGVIKDIPLQSHFHFDFFIAMSGLDESRENAWFSSNFNTYLLLKPGADVKRLSAKLSEFMHKNAGPQMESILHMTFDKFEQSGDFFRLNLIPLKKIHLESNRVGELGPNGNIQYVYIFSAIAIFILLIACVNFMNLSTARSSNRAREVGVRKVLGSPRKFLVAQFLTESIMVTLAATLIAVFISVTLLPLFNQMAAKELTITSQIAIRLLPVLLTVVLIIGFLAGSYPALFLSGFKPIDVLKGKLAAGFKGGMLRSFLVVFQFAISIFLIIGTLVIYNQLKYIQSKDLGYNRNHILIVWGPLGESAKAIKNEVKHLSGVENATLSLCLPTVNYGNTTSYFKEPMVDQKKAMLTQVWTVDEDYINTLGMKMIAGRNFSKDIYSDSTAIIINESAAKLLNLADPLNQFLYSPADNMATRMNKFHIIGIMKDFNFKSLRENVTPLLLRLGEDRGALSMRIKTSNIPLLLVQIKSKFKQIVSDQQVRYTFMDDDFDSIYRAEDRMGKIFITFTSLAIIIACLGLFGLAAYAAEQRTKEIGIRKVLGANVITIVRMLSVDFIKLVIISILIASPLAWFVMKKWLQGFAYRQEIQWWVFAIAGLGAILIAFVTISFQSIKAALANSATSLKAE